jgi:hypothetical protein
MITALVILVFTQTKPAASQSIYRSPKIAWLNDSRVTWDFTKTSYSIITKGKLQERQGSRYMDFQLEYRDAKGKVTKEEGSFNFWSNDRLLMVGLIDNTQLKLLKNGNKILLEEEDISAIIPDLRSKKNVYVRIYSRKGQPIPVLRQLLDKIKTVAP